MDIDREEGIALMVTMMAMLLMSALGAALVLTTSSEMIIATNFRSSGEGLYAADAALERIVGDLLAVPDWDSLLSGALQSAFIDGAPAGSRTLSDGSIVDLTRVLALANCRKITPCTDSEMDLVTHERPWGRNNPRWRLFGYGHLSDLMPTASVSSPYYVVVMAGDDAAELDADATHDGTSPCVGAIPVKGPGEPPGWSCNPGTGVLGLRAEAFGPGGTHKIIEMTVARASTAAGQNSVAGEPQDYNTGTGQAGIRVLSWREER
jgi:hypothetical protein